VTGALEKDPVRRRRFVFAWVPWGALRAPPCEAVAVIGNCKGPYLMVLFFVASSVISFLHRRVSGCDRLVQPSQRKELIGFALKGCGVIGWISALSGTDLRGSGRLLVSVWQPTIGFRMLFAIGALISRWYPFPRGQPASTPTMRIRPFIVILVLF